MDLAGVVRRCTGRGGGGPERPCTWNRPNDESSVDKRRTAKDKRSQAKKEHSSSEETAKDKRRTSEVKAKDKRRTSIARAKKQRRKSEVKAKEGTGSTRESRHDSAAADDDLPPRRVRRAGVRPRLRGEQRALQRGISDIEGALLSRQSRGCREREPGENSALFVRAADQVARPGDFTHAKSIISPSRYVI